MGFFVGGGWVGRNMSILEISIQKKLKKSLSHCQGFVHHFELGEEGNFHVLAKGGGGGGGGRNFLKNRYSEIDLMHFGGTYSHSGLAHAQNNWDSTF